MRVYDTVRIVRKQAGVGGSTAFGLQVGHGSCLELTGSAGLIGSDCGHLLAIRPARDCVLGYLDTMKV